MLRDFSIQQAISFLFLVSLLVFSRLFVLITSRNSTEVTEFFLLGFGVQYEFQYFLFTVFLVIYGTSMVGIIGMILLIKIDSRLQTPMYFFLQHLAFVDICFISVVTPKMMQNFIIEINLLIIVLIVLLLKELNLLIVLMVRLQYLFQIKLNFLKIEMI